MSGYATEWEISILIPLHMYEAIEILNAMQRRKAKFIVFPRPTFSVWFRWWHVAFWYEYLLRLGLSHLVYFWILRQWQLKVRYRFIPSTFTVVLLVYSVSSSNALTFIRDQRIYCFLPLPIKDIKAGHYPTASKTLFEWRFVYSNGVLLAGR